MAAHQSPPPLLYADTHASSDMLYFGGVEVHDPFIAFGSGRKRITVQSALELGRVKRASSFDLVLSLETWRDLARETYGPKAGVAEIITLLARKHGIKSFRIPDDFPAGLYHKLGKLGLKLELAGGMLFPGREIKSEAEANAIREGNRLAAIGYATTENILCSAQIKGRSLIYQGKPLSSERLRFAIEVAIKEQGGDARDTIVAGGNQACDPHERGSGPLRPHELVIVDIFPRVLETGYYGDMTRTYLKGRASEAQRKLVTTVRDAQRAALRMIRAGVDGSDVHDLVNFIFTRAGYETRHDKTGSVGFFHGTGHGLGLAVHEPPRISTVAYQLKAGSVVTVEPGLYYPGLGGCRWEDVVQVTKGPAQLLSKHPYNWEIK